MKSNKLCRGFTLIEIVVVVAIFVMVAFLTVPQVLRILYRARIEGTAQEMVVLLRASRYEAIKRNCYGVVMINPGQRRVVAFADVDRDGLLNTTVTPPDVVIGGLDLPKMLDFKDESGNLGLNSVKDLINPDVPNPLPDKQVMYREDGSVLSTGALRVGDPRGNVLEVYVAPQGSGKVQIRKHLTGTQYVAKGQVREWTYK